MSIHEGWNILRFTRVEHSPPALFKDGKTYEAYRFFAINMSSHEVRFVFITPHPQDNPPSIIRDLLGCAATKYWMDVFVVLRKNVLCIEKMKPMKMPQEEINIMHRMGKGEPKR